MNLFEEIEKDHQKFLKEVSSGVYSRNVNSHFKSVNNPKGFLWDTFTNKKTYEFDPKRVLKVKIVKPHKFNQNKFIRKETKFSKYIDEISSHYSKKDSTPVTQFLKPVIVKSILPKNRLSPMNIFKAKNNKKQVQFSSRSIFQLANKFRK